MCDVGGCGEGDSIRFVFEVALERFVGVALVEAYDGEACRFDMMLSVRACGNGVVYRACASERRGRQIVRGSMPRGLSSSHSRENDAAIAELIR